MGGKSKEGKLDGFIPGNTNAEFMYITGAIVSWWARTEGIMVHDVFALRTWAFSKRITNKRLFPTKGKDLVTQWRGLLENGYREFELEVPNLSKVVNDALELLDFKNTLVHSFWPYGQQDREVLELSWIKPGGSAEHGVVRGNIRVTLVDLDKINTRLAHLYTAVMAASFNSHKLYQLAQERYPIE